MKRILILALVLSSCTSGLRENKGAPVRANRSTVVLFLVDGLGVKALQAALKKNRLPNIRRFFLRKLNSFAVAQASFPTQTYPNIASILTTKAVGEQPVIANHVLLPNGKVGNYESADFHPALRALIDPQSVIGRLESEGRETASFSYIFGLNAASRMRVGVKEGLEYQRSDYLGLDDRLLTSLNEFLVERKDSRYWPEFIYVHLVGVDAVSHRFGDQSKEALEYLTWLDGRFAPALQTLSEGEKRKEVVTLLTSDHGFTETKRYVSLRKKMIKADLELVVTNEGRFLSIHLPENKAPEELEKALVIARAEKGVELTAWRKGLDFEIATAKSKFRFTYGPAACGFPYSLALQPGEFQCPTDFDEKNSNYPFLVSQLSRYLAAPGHPDAIVLAQPDVSFSKGARASHGGPTADETFVPVLLRNASLNGHTLTSDLLKILFQARPSMENMKAKPAARQARAQ